jgi:hypothetical protein
MSEANNLTAALLIEIPKQVHGVRLWRNNRVSAMALGRGGKMRKIDAGIDGQADISGIAAVPMQRLNSVGIRLEIEVKAGRDKQREAQINFQEMILKHGGIYLIARDLEVTISQLVAILNAYAKLSLPANGVSA